MSGRHRNRTGLSLKKIRNSGPSRDATGQRIKPSRELLGSQALAKRSVYAKENQLAHLQGQYLILFTSNQLLSVLPAEMNADERRALDALRELPVADESDPDIILDDINVESILDGSEVLEISHAGGEFEALTDELRKV